MTDRNNLLAALYETKMYHSQSSAAVSSRPKGFEPAIGQIDLLDAHGETLRSWRIQSSKCTIGSGADCTIQLGLSEAAPLHATLIFGKRHTLLRAIAPTKIANRNIREWLIDHPTEVTFGATRLVVHPSVGVMATVVQAEQLLDRAARLCSDSASVIPATLAQPSSPAINTSNHVDDEVPSQPSDPSQEVDGSLSNSETKERFERIEQMLLALQSSLDRVQETIQIEPKDPEADLSETVASHFDSFGKTLFSTLSDQFTSQTERHESLLTNLSEKVAVQFATIDQQLQYVTESNSQQSIHLGELLEYAIAEQSLIEMRFSEVAANRDELMQALQILHAEIVNANDAYANSFQNFTQSFVQAQSQTQSPTHDHVHFPSQDQLLAESLEKAQLQIQEYNQQLRELEAERQSAEQRIIALSDSLGTGQERLETTNLEASAFAENYVSDFENSLKEPDEVQQQGYLQPHEEMAVEKPQLPAWFTNSEPDVQSERSYGSDPYAQAPEPSMYDSYEVMRNSSADSVPDPRQYAEVRSDDDQSSYGDVQTSESDVYPNDEAPYTSETDAEAISERLKRMIVDADTRRGTNSGNSSTGSRRWSQTYGPSSASKLETPNVETRTPSYEQVQEPLEMASEVTASVEHQATDVAFIESAANYDSRDDENVRDPIERAPAHQERVPAHQERVPVHQERVPAHQERVPLHNDRAPVHNDRVPVNNDRAPVHNDRAPVHNDRAPVHNDRAPVHNEPSTPEVNTIPEGNTTDDEQEESIEEYMQRLLQRVRTGSDVEPSALSSPKAGTKEAITNSKGKSRVAASLGLDVEKGSPQPEMMGPLTQESFVPRQQAPELRNDLTALRELANSNARRAISKSDTRRSSSAFYFKLAVTAVSASSAVALLMLNGFNINMPFAGMVAAVIVSFLWGFDCLNHFTRLKSEDKNTPASNSHNPAMNSIQVGQNDSMGEHWRPTPV